MNRKPQILFVGDDWYGSNATSLRDALMRAGCQVQTINTNPYSNPAKHCIRRVWKKTERQTYDRMASNVLAGQVRERVQASKFDLLIAFKGLTLCAATLDSLTFRRLHYHPDDSTNPTHRSAVFDEAEAHYDMHITTKSFNVAEIARRTGKPVGFIWCAYDREWHRPMPYAPDHMFGFIGTRRVDRENLLRQVSEAYPGDFLISGSGWASLKGLRSATVLPGAFGTEFSKIVARAPIQLGLLNSDNRDLHTCRSFEAPAAGALLVAERTVEHSEMFEDGKDALLFSHETELLEILARLQRSPELRARLRLASHERITRSANSYDDRALQILDLAADL